MNEHYFQALLPALISITVVGGSYLQACHLLRELYGLNFQSIYRAGITQGRWNYPDIVCLCGYGFKHKSACGYLTP